MQQAISLFTLLILFFSFKAQNNSIVSHPLMSVYKQDVGKICALGKSPGSGVQASDTLWVGTTALNDTLEITGTYTHTGPVIVAGAGLLKINKADFTNDGNLYVLTYGKVIIDSSSVSFPQSYFYQRSLLVVEHGYVEINNSTIDHSGLSHSMIIANYGTVKYKNVTHNSFTTTGMNDQASFIIDGTNKAGEVVIADSCTVNFKNATTALLWHQFPDTAVINWSFGTNDTTYNYEFNKTKPGVKGVEYNVQADSVYDVMWALMPSSSSDVTISNSTIRGIGVWFDKKDDSTIVSGLYDSTGYSAFTAPLSDRNLVLNNSYVQTWSLYIFKNAIININNCQVGEIGNQSTSKFYGSNYIVDGTGGYQWTTDTTVAFGSNMQAWTYARSEGSSYFIIDKSALVRAEAITKSTLILVQTLVSHDTNIVVREGAVIWNNYLLVFTPAYIDSLVYFAGSAWIDRGPTSTLPDFDHWQLFYQKQGDLTWTPITSTVTTEVRSALFPAVWNTNGLTAGNYIVKLTLTDNSAFPVDNYIPIVLLPKTVRLDEFSNTMQFSFYPNPAADNVNVVIYSSVSERVQIEIYNALGEVILSEVKNITSGENRFSIPTEGLSRGIYYIRFLNGKGEKQMKFIKD